MKEARAQRIMLDGAKTILFHIWLRRKQPRKCGML
jgi:hypothetical protein